MSVRADLPIGSELLGYRIESVLGRGGMGVVYLAEDLRLKRKVALKLSAPELEQSDVFRDRFLLESELAASLDHANVVPIYEAGEADGLLFIAMRYVDGSDLRRLLAQGRLPPGRALEVAGQVAGALDAAHARGLVHGDVKPSNVLIDADGHAYLADFGLTKRLSEQGSDRQGLQGTFAYVAPEQIRGEEVDGQADLYSLGCLLHECLTGVPPFGRDSDLAVLFAHLEADPPAPHGLEEVMQRALAKDPEDRYRSGHELVDAAREALGLAEPRRARWPLVAVALAFVLAAAGLLAFFLMRSPLVAVPQARAAVVELDGESGKVAARVAVGKTLTGVAAGGGAIWLSDSGGSALIRLDPRTYATQSVAAQGVPGDVSVDRRFVAIANGDNGTVAVFDAATGQPHTIAHITGGGLQAVCDVALDGSTGWATDCLNRRIVEFDADSGRFLRAVPLPPRVNNEATIDRLFADIAVGAGAVWVAGDALDPTLYRLDRVTGRVVAEIPVPAGTVGLAVGAGAVWLANQLDDSVVRVDPATNRVVGTVRVGREPLAVAVGVGSVWTANALDGTVSRIDPARNAVTRTFEVGSNPVAISAGSSGVWIAEDPR